MPFELVKLHFEPDGTFPNGIPNPLLPENRGITRDAVLANGAGLGIAWDGDFDRCFLDDESGRFIEGYYIVGLLAEAIGTGPAITSAGAVAWVCVVVTYLRATTLREMV